MGPPSVTQIPVLLGGNNYRHVMGTVEWEQDGDNVKMVLSVSATGENASDLVAYLTSGEPQALQFVAIPVTPRRT